MGRLFGTDGIRGVANQDLTCELATKLGRAAAAVLTNKSTRHPRVIIGKDTRLSSDMLESAMAAGLCSVGASVVLLGVVPTPAVAYLVEKYKADAGVMISGALAGLGGLIFVVPTSTNFNATVSGYGFLALAVLIFGQWKPGRIALAAIFFAIFKSLANIYDSISWLNALHLTKELYNMMPFAASMIILAFTSKRSRAPKAEGIPYDKGQR